MLPFKFGIAVHRSYALTKKVEYVALLNQGMNRAGIGTSQNLR
jgi:hypothetical protein